MKLIEYIKSNPNWKDELKNDPFNLLIQEKEDLIIFKYIQGRSDFSHPLVRESRGLILNKYTLEPVCIPFFKFFNFGESYADKIDLNRAKIVNKLDGSLIKVHFYKDQWKIATNGTIDAKDASSRIDSKVSFEDLFFDIIPKNRFNLLFSSLNKGFTYLFEIVHPLSPIIVDYNGKKFLTLIGIRNNKTLEELNIYSGQYDLNLFFNFGIKIPEIYDLNIENLDELSNIADQYNESGIDFEGFVVFETSKDEKFIIKRVKIKSPKYLKFHHLAGEQGIQNSIIDIILKGEIEEFESYLDKLPSYIEKEYENIKFKYDELLEKLFLIRKKYGKMARKFSRKEVALHGKDDLDSSLLGFMFSMVYNRIEPQKCLNQCSRNKLKQLLGVKNNGDFLSSS